MKKLTSYLLAAVFCISLYACSSSKMATVSANDEQQIGALIEEENELIRNGSRKELVALTRANYTNDFIGAGPTGLTETKDSVLARRLRLSEMPVTAPTKPETYKREVTSINVYGNAAVATGKITSRTEASANAGMHPGEYTFTYTYVKQNGQWKKAAGHASRIDPDEGKAKEEILAFYNNMRERQLGGGGDIKQTIAFIENNYTNSFKGLNSTGVFIPKDSILARNRRYVESAGISKPFYETVRREDLKIDYYGDAAVVTSKLIQRSHEQAKAGVDPIESRSIAFLVREDGRWTLAGESRAPIRDTAKDKEQILALENEGLELDLRGDNKAIVAFIEKTVSDDHIFTQQDRQVSKAEFIRIYNEKKEDKEDDKLETLRNENLKIQVYDNSAVVTGRAVLRSKGQAKANKPYMQQSFTRTYVKQDGVWKVVADHRSPFSEVKNKQATVAR